MAHASSNGTGFQSFQATAVAIAIGKRVTVNASRQISVAAAAVGAIGVTIEPVAASGVGVVKLFSAPGTFLMVANGAIVAGAQLFPTASGNVDDAGTTAIPYVALEAASAQNDIIEVAEIALGA